MLSWNLIHGEHLDFYLDMRRHGLQVRELDERPSLYWDLDPHFRAFVFLNPRRSPGLSGTAPISAQEILAYLEIHRVEDPSDRRIAAEMIARIDRIFLGLCEEAKKKRGGAAK